MRAGSKWGDDGGNCQGKFNDSTSTSPYNAADAFNGTGTVLWSGNDNVEFSSGVPLVQVDSMTNHIPSAPSPQLFIDHGQWYGTPNYSIIQSGVDPAKIRRPGGPLYIDVEYHHPFGVNSCYSFDLRGYLWCGPSCR